MKAIILVAGRGTRLNQLTKDIPKCLITLNGETILDYQIQCLIKYRVDQILIVVGYKKNRIIEHLKDSKSLVKFIYNNIFDITNNTYSLSLALKSTKKDSIIILDGDILFDIKLLQNLINSKHKNILVVDNIKEIEPDDCKVLIKDNYAVEIGKEVQGSVVYTSMIKLEGEFLDEFKKELARPENRQEWYSESLNKLLIKYPKKVHVMHTNGILRCEIDTYKDLVNAKKIYRKIKGRYD